MEESETPSTLYGNAVYGWSLRQAELLRAGHYDDVDELRCSQRPTAGPASWPRPRPACR